MRRLIRWLQRRYRRARYRMTVEPPAWADNPPTTGLAPLDPDIAYDITTFRGI